VASREWFPISVVALVVVLWFVTIIRALIDPAHLRFFAFGIPLALVAVGSGHFLFFSRSQPGFLARVRVASLTAGRSLPAVVSVICLGLGARDAIGLILQFPRAAQAVSVLVVGALLFLFRLKRRATYGAVEVIVGVMVGVERFEGTSLLPSNASLTLGILCAGVYLVVRGLDNVHQGMTQEPVDAWASYLWRRPETDGERPG
jgi:hypothetical protein